jgi:hypothetical protein
MDSAKHSDKLFEYLRVMFSSDGLCMYETGSAKTAPKSHSVPIGGTDCVSVEGQRD